MKQNLKTLIMSGLCGLALAAAPNVGAITIGVDDEHYLGSFSPPEPAGDSLERANVQNLIDLFNGSSNYDSDLNNRVYELTLDGSAIPDPAPNLASGNGVQQAANGAFTFNVSGAEYILAKYANQVAHVWYVADLDEVVLPNLWSTETTGMGLSHITRFDAVNRVPDGGATLALLGAGLLGIGTLRRRVAR